MPGLGGIRRAYGGRKILKTHSPPYQKCAKIRAEMHAKMRAKRHVEIHAKMHAGMHVKMHAEITCPSETIRGLLFVWFACSLRSAMGFTARDLARDLRRGAY